MTSIYGSGYVADMNDNAPAQPAPVTADEQGCVACVMCGAPAAPVPVPLTDEQIALAIFEARVGHSPFRRDGSTSFRIARAAIAKFCEVNGIAASPEKKP
jgi:hypothetical protein